MKTISDHNLSKSEFSSTDEEFSILTIYLMESFN